MRGLICVVFSIAVAFSTSSEAAAATVESSSIELSSKTIADSPLHPLHALGSTFTKESRKRSLRINQAADGDTKVLSASDEERASKVLKQVTDKLKTTSAGKRLKATGKEMKKTVKKIPGLGNLKKLRLYRKYSGLYKGGWTPNKAKEAGKIKTTEEFVQYQAFYQAAGRKSGKVHHI